MSKWTPLKYYEGIYEVNDKGRIRSIKSKSSEYSAWEALKQRCTNENHHSYSYSSAQLCKEWLSFINFINDLGKKKDPKDVLIRLDNYKGYTIDNCVSCCKICNRAKGSLPLETFQKWIERLKNG